MPSSADVAGALAAIEARLTANWSATPVIYDNNAPTPEPWPPENTDGSPAPWVFCEIIDVDARIIGFGLPGDQTVMDTGFVKLNVMVARDSGLADGRTKAVALGEIFRQARFYDTDPTAYVRTTTPRVGRGGMASDDGNYVAVSCTVPYEFYHRA